MPKLKDAVPKYRKHKASGQAVVTIAGTDHYLGHSRRYLNDNIDRLRRMFRWGVSEELVSESTLRPLETVDGLRKGKTNAPDHPSVPPVDDIVVNATIQSLQPTVADMVRIQSLTGARPGEICIMRPFDIEMRNGVWFYLPERHKTQHHGKERVVVIGPKAQSILNPYLDREPLDYCFKPSDVIAHHRRIRHAKRVTPLSCGSKPKKKNKRSKRAAGDCYTNDSYRRAIHRACDWAFPPPNELAQREDESQLAWMRRLDEAQRAELARWQSEHRWSPNQLRHTMGTKTREQFGIEAVAAALGHSKTDTSEIYAQRNLQLAVEVAKKTG